MLMCALVSQAAAANTYMYCKSPRFDFFPHEGDVLVPFLTFEQWLLGPGRWVSSSKHGEAYGEMVYSFLLLSAYLEEEYSVEMIPITFDSVQSNLYDDPAKLNENWQKCPVLMWTEHDGHGPEKTVVHGSGSGDYTAFEDKDGRRPEYALFTGYGIENDDDPLLCGAIVAHDRQGILRQRNYYTCSPEGLEEMTTDMLLWIKNLGLETMHTTTASQPATCSCCGTLAGRTLDLPRSVVKTPRNSLCSCGSGKKSKRCCG